jgi:hypothetical protein
MIATKQNVISYLEKMPDDCSLEDIQYQLFVKEKISRGIKRTESQGATSQQEIEEKYKKWIMGQ